MITTKVLTGFFNKVRNLFNDFPLVPLFIYDNNLDFETVGSQYIAKEDIFQKLPESETNQWILLLWKRTNIKPVPFQNRGIYSVHNPEIMKNFKFKMATTTLSLSFVCSDITLGESLEEFIVLNLPEDFEFSYDVENLGEFRGIAKLNMDYSFEKFELTNFGSVISINLDFDVVYHIFGNENSSSIIEHIPLMIMDKKGNLLEQDLIE